MANCKSCHALIRWVTMAATGKANPLDAEPVENGNIEVMEVRGRDIGRIVSDEARLFPVPLYLAHWATCPDAAKWRKGKKA